MSDANCIFCKIINRDIPSDIILETDQTIVIKDINPKAPVHYLVIPKVHVKNFHHVTDEHYPYLADAMEVIKHLGDELSGNKSFNVLLNNGEAAGQSVMHLHWHFVSGRNIGGEF